MKKLIFFILTGGCLYNNILCAAIPELDMKSAYLYNFAQFADWPPSDRHTFNICTLDKVSDSLSPEVLSNKTVHGKPIKLAQFSKLIDKSECQIVYLNSADTAYVAKIAEELSAQQVLTVGDAVNGNDFAIINLFVKNNRLVFDLDLTRARKAKVTLSSKLITLAQQVRD